jgi:hypothetical protein
MRSFQPKWDVLPPAQKQLWPELAPAAGLGFVLYGGTAIAMRLGHRASVDFDFFSEAPLDKGKVVSAFPFLPSSTVLQESPDSLTVLTRPEPEAGVKVSFFGSIDFGRVGEPELADALIPVASLDDLMATKLKVILQRVEAKDYRDLAALLRAGLSLPKGLAAGRVLYGPNFQPSESLKAMVYFEGGDLKTLGTEEKETLIRAAAAVRKLPHMNRVSFRLSG